MNISKLVIAFLIGFTLISGGVYLLVIKNNDSTTNETDFTNEQQENMQEDQDAQPKIILDTQMCTQFSETFVSNALGQKIYATKYQSASNYTTFTCQYYLTENTTGSFVSLTLAYLDIEKQKQGQEILDRTIEINKDIPMENFIAIQDDGNINAIYLVLHSMAYVRVDRSNNSLDNDELINFAIKVAEDINK